MSSQNAYITTHHTRHDDKKSTNREQLPNTITENLFKEKTYNSTTNKTKVYNNTNNLAIGTHQN